MIDKEKLINQLESEFAKAHNTYLENEEDYFYAAVCSALGTTIKLVRRQPEVNNWIPVTMQLPEEPAGNFNDIEEIENAILQGQLTEYIVTIANATESTALYYAGDGYWWDDESKDFYNVAAWQPLPEPYKAM